MEDYNSLQYWMAQIWMVIRLYVHTSWIQVNTSLTTSSAVIYQKFSSSEKPLLCYQRVVLFHSFNTPRWQRLHCRRGIVLWWDVAFSVVAIFLYIILPAITQTKPKFKRMNTLLIHDIIMRIISNLFVWHKSQSTDNHLLFILAAY